MRAPIATAFAALAVLAVSVAAYAASGNAVRNAFEEVFIVNWPEVQPVDGRVGIVGPVELARSLPVREIVVAPVDRTQTTRLVDAGIVRTAGFAGVRLSLVGQTKGTVGREGRIGAVLIPEIPFATEAFHERGELLFPLLVETPDVSARSPYFASQPVSHEVRFDTYRVYLFNGTDKSADIAVHAYLTN